VNDKKSRAVVLIERLIRDGVFSEDELARELVVGPKTLADYRAGTTPVPADRQMCLALLMMQLPGKYVRMGCGLRDQVRAATRYEARIAGFEDTTPATT
jgi:hypothetical protein